MRNEFASERIAMNSLLEQEPLQYCKLQSSLSAVLRKLHITWFFSQANVVLKEKETFIEYLQKQFEETKNKLDSEVCVFLSEKI